jgi:hypothetical protein
MLAGIRRLSFCNATSTTRAMASSPLGENKGTEEKRRTNKIVSLRCRPLRRQSPLDDATSSVIRTYGGYELAREAHEVTIQDILRAASNATQEAGEASNSEILDKVVLPILSVAEQGLGLALNRITLDDMVRRARTSPGLCGVRLRKRNLAEELGVLRHSAVLSGHESKNGSVA